MSNKKFILATGLIFALLVGWSVYDYLNVSEDKVYWIFEYDSALNEANGENKPLLVYFYTSWCSWCRKLQKETYNNVEVAAFLNDNFVCLKINAEKHPTLLTQYHIAGYPTIIFLSSEGEEIGRITGYVVMELFLIKTRSYL